MNKVNIKSCMLFSAFFFLAVITLRAQHLQKVWPEQVGMSSQVLALADSALNAEIQAKEIPGAVLAITDDFKSGYCVAHCLQTSGNCFRLFRRWFCGLARRYWHARPAPPSGMQFYPCNFARGSRACSPDC